MSRPFSVEACDFSGWATRNDLKCSDGRVIRRDAFKNNDGIKVPLVWNHQHNSPRDVLGHAWLENREEGVYTYGFLNDTTDGEIAKVLIKHGDICALSIYANQLQQAGPDVLHGCICEVSLVHKGANPGAFIDSMLKHGEMSDDEAIIYTGMPLCLSHSAESKDDPEDEEKKKDSKEDKSAENKEEKKDNEETIADVIDSMSEKQQNVMYALIAQALEGEPEKESKDDSDNKSESNKEDNTMKHNVLTTISRRRPRFCLMLTRQASFLWPSPTASAVSVLLWTFMQSRILTVFWLMVSTVLKPCSLSTRMSVPVLLNCLPLTRVG